MRDLIVRITESKKISHKNLIKAKIRSKEQYDKEFRPPDAKIEDTVYALKKFRDGKFDTRATGPSVAGLTENNNVILETEDGERLMKNKDKLLLDH